jgi:hypothetical protein
MKVLVVSRTRMQSGICIGALAGDGMNVRLIPPGRQNHPDDAAYQIGEVWDMELRPLPGEPPHVEDHLIQGARRIGRAASPASLIPSRAAVWRGPPSAIFDGTLRYRNTGRAYVGRDAVPSGSVGFWVPDRALESQLLWGKHGYVYWWPDGRRAAFRYVGLDSPIETIPAGSLVRVSLARWWSPPDDPDAVDCCYAQISGWYLD